MVAQNIGLFGMLNAMYNVVGTGCSAAEKGMRALDNLAGVGELKTSVYLQEEQLMGEEKLAMLKFKRDETLARLKLEAQARLESSVVATA